jgi:hypothetical protein
MPKGDKKSGSGHPASRKGGEKGGRASASRPASQRSASARKAAATRRRNQENGNRPQA